MLFVNNTMTDATPKYTVSIEDYGKRTAELDLTKELTSNYILELSEFKLGENTQVSVFFDEAKLYIVPKQLSEVQIIQDTIKRVLTKLKSEDSTKVLDLIKQDLDDKSKYETIRKVIRNFNEIKKTFSRLYVCTLVYLRQHETATKNLNDKVAKLREFLQETTAFLLRLDDVSDIDKDIFDYAMPPINVAPTS